LPVQSKVSKEKLSKEEIRRALLKETVSIEETKTTIKTAQETQKERVEVSVAAKVEAFKENLLLRRKAAALVEAKVRVRKKSKFLRKKVSAKVVAEAEVLRESR